MRDSKKIGGELKVKDVKLRKASRLLGNGVIVTVPMGKEITLMQVTKRTVHIGVV